MGAVDLDKVTVGEAMDARLLRVSPAVRWSMFTTASNRLYRDMSPDAKRVADELGVLPCALLLKALRRRTSSGWLSVPKALKPDHWIRKAIGDVLADRLRIAVGGEKLDVRRRDVVAIAERDDWIRWHCRNGESPNDIAQWYDVTPRRVRQLRALD